MKNVFITSGEGSDHNQCLGYLVLGFVKLFLVCLNVHHI